MGWEYLPIHFPLNVAIFAPHVGKHFIQGASGASNYKRGSHNIWIIFHHKCNLEIPYISLFGPTFCSPKGNKYKNYTDVIPVPLQHVFWDPCLTGFWAHFAVFIIKSLLSFCKARSSAFRELPLGKKLNRWMPDHSRDAIRSCHGVMQGKNGSWKESCTGRNIWTL